MLTAKRQTFVNEYCIDRNASRAARAAGYSAVSAKVTASRLLTDANVRAAVTLREMDAERALGVTRERVLKALQGAFELARQQSDPAAMIAACREISRVCGYYPSERRTVNLSAVPTNTALHFDSMSDAELFKIMEHEPTKPTNC